MPKIYKWLYSCETYAFDTPDGCIHQGEYAFNIDDIGGYVVYDPNNSWNFLRVDALNITGMTEIRRAINNRAFDVFEDPDTGKKVRFACDLQIYRDLAKPNAKERPNKLKE